MKKVFILAAVGGLFFVTSCKKTYTCECTVLGTTTSVEAEFKKKADAEAWCEDDSAGLCSLK